MQDKQIEQIIKREKSRQRNHIELIASENYVSRDVLRATGSVLTNKYAEGYPNKRYYDGCEFVDQIELLAQERLKKLFQVKYVNVQAHSGSSANSAAFAALVKPGEKIMGASLESGGHLSHGYPVSFSGTFYKSASYNTNARGVFDYNQIRKIALRERPKLIICGYSAYSRKIDFKKFREIADEVKAFLVADIAHIAGLVAAKVHPSPVQHAHLVTSTTHKTLRGARGGIVMTNDAKLAAKVDKWIFPGYQGGPLMHAIAGKAVCFREALQESFKTYAQNVVKNARAFANEFMINNISVVANGTDNHLFTINVKKELKLTGQQASKILQRNNITVNKNTIPNDSESPFVTSGIRLGTAAMTTRKFGVSDFRYLARLIIRALQNPRVSVRKEVAQLTRKHPVPKKFT